MGMNAPTFPRAAAAVSEAPIPIQVQKLWARERELATIVYTRGPSTALEVQERLSASLSNAAVRSILSRLVDKQILGCIPGRRGRGCPAVYVPVEVPHQAKVKAIRQLSESYFSGSLAELIRAALATASRDGNAGEIEDLIGEIAAQR